MRFFLLTTFILLFSFVDLTAQQEDPVLFSVANQPVHKSEFQYIYNKNNGKNADYSKESIDEYLDLYVKFKLKVQKAKALKLDTIKVLQDELAGYRQQLANSYLVDKEVTQRLVDEAYERKKHDVKVKHILFGVPNRPSQAALVNALEQARKVKEKLEQGADFNMMAKTLSTDRNTAQNGGSLGWLSAMLPSGFYDLETAMYNLEVGDHSQPVKTPLGYHIISVVEKRPARGEMEVSHILIRDKSKGRPIKNVSSKIDSIHKLLIASPNDFEKFVSQYSDDINTVKKKGYLGFFGTGQFELPFEETAFGLKKDGDISIPVKTSIGYHIIKRISRKDYNNQQKVKAELLTQLKQNDRAANAKRSLIDQIKKNADFKEFSLELSAFANKLTTEFYSYKWEIPALNDNAICSFHNKKVLTKEFAEYCKKSTRTRLKFNKTTPLQQSVKEMYNAFTDEMAIQYEEENLEARYPEFKSLMREYEEGILLFEATKINVWDKASQDIEGLTKFHDKNKSNYIWNPRGVVDLFTLKSMDDKLINQLSKLISSKSPKEILQLINTKEKLLVHERLKQEVGGKDFIGLEWKAGSVSTPAKDPRNNTTTLKKLHEILPASTKTMDEARGYIIADYQDELEKVWVKSLSEEYKVKIDKKIVKSLIKK